MKIVSSAPFFIMILLSACAAPEVESDDDSWKPGKTSRFIVMQFDAGILESMNITMEEVRPVVRDFCADNHLLMKKEYGHSIEMVLRDGEEFPMRAYRELKIRVDERNYVHIDRISSLRFEGRVMEE